MKIQIFSVLSSTPRRNNDSLCIEQLIIVLAFVTKIDQEIFHLNTVNDLQKKYLSLEGITKKKLISCISKLVIFIYL